MTKRQSKRLLTALIVVVLLAVQALAEHAEPTTAPAASSQTPLDTKPAVQTAQLSGKAIKVSDGDTLTLLTTDKQQVRVRLGEIDTPEKKQAWGQKARQALSDKVFEQHIEVAVQDIDRYGRVVGLVYVNGHEVNRQLIEEGHAWAYRDYLKRPELIQLEQAARDAKRGLWALPAAERQAPWEWRRAQRENR